jgi:predicted transcriptional regulator
MAEFERPERPTSIKELCKKLRPVYGEKMDRLYLRYELADTLEEKRHIEQAIKVLYEKALSTSLLAEKVLLEPPAESRATAGDYPLGTILYADKEVGTFGLREQDWIRHVCITGMSGSGKTNFAYMILSNFIKRGKPVLVFDWKKSFRPLLAIDPEMLCFTIGNPRVADFFRFNINTPPTGVDPKEWIGLLVDLITESFSASFGVHKILVETLDRAFKDFGVYQGSENYPTWYQIKDRLEQRSQESKRGRESEWLESAMRIAHSLTFGPFGDIVCAKDRGGFKIEDLLDKRVLFELASLNNTQKKFFCEFVLTYIFKHMKSTQEVRDSFRMAILVDEAHNIFLNERADFIQESVTDTVYRELREFGVSLICLDQHISKLSETVPGNSATNVAFQQILPQDVEVVANLMGLRERRQYFGMLPVGEAIVKLAERAPNPFLIRIPLVRLKAEVIPDDAINAKMKAKVSDIKKEKLVKEGVRSEDVARQLEHVEKVFKATPVSLAEPPGYAIDKLQNHIQQEIAELLGRQLMLGFSMDDIKAHLINYGYKPTDVHKALQSLNLKQLRQAQGAAAYVRETKEAQQALEILVKQGPQSISNLYKLMGLSVRKCDAIRHQLESLGLVIIREQRTEKGMKKVVSVTDEGFKMIIRG